MNRVLNAKLTSLLTTLDALGSRLTSLQPWCRQLAEDLKRLQHSDLDFNQAQTVCLKNFKNKALYQHNLPMHAAAHRLVEEAIKQFFHLHTHFKKIACGERPAASNFHSNIFFKKLETTDDIIKRIDDALNKLKQLTNPQAMIPERRANK